VHRQWLHPSTYGAVLLPVASLQLIAEMLQSELPLMLVVLVLLLL
jgi:hypothetical protein